METALKQRLQKEPSAKQRAELLSKKAKEF